MNSPFRPSNGTEGMIFEERYCFKCNKFLTCTIFEDAQDYDIGDPEYPKELVYLNEKPTCTAFEDLNNAQTI